MAYSESNDVVLEFKSLNIDAANSAITSDQIDGFIEQADAEIDSIIGLKYQTPVTASASALLVLKQCSVWMVASRIKDILEVKNVTEEVNQDVKKTMRQMALDILNAIAKGTKALPGATLMSSADGLTSWAAQDTTSDSDYTFKKNEDQW